MNTPHRIRRPFFDAIIRLSLLIIILMRTVLLSRRRHLQVKCLRRHFTCKCRPEGQSSSLALHRGDFALQAHLCKTNNLFCREKGLRHVEWAGASSSGAFHDVEVDHGGGHVGMAEEVLDSADVDAAFEEVGGETVAKGVASGRFGKAGLAHGRFELALHGSVVKMVSGNPSGSRMRAQSGGGK